MEGLHITDLEALRRFSQEFSAICRNLQTDVSAIKHIITRTTAWLRQCKEDAQEAIENARSEVERCRYDLDYCESQEDEDYIPDCSAEEDALDEAEDKLRTCLANLKRINELEFQFKESKSALLSNIRRFRGFLDENTSKGNRYLRDQIVRMEELLQM